MKRILILALIVLGMISCKKEEVGPNDIYTPPVYVPPVSVETNHVILTINSFEVGDSLRITHNGYTGMVRVVIINSAKYYLCNLVSNLPKDIDVIGDCNTNTIELIGVETIKFKYKGDVSVDYL